MNSRRHPSGDPKYAGGERDDDFGPSRFVFSPNKRRTAPANRPHQASSNDNSIDPDTSADPIDLFETIAGTKHNIASRNAKTYGGGRSLLSSSKDRTSKNSQLSSESESGSKELSSKLHTKRKTKKAPKTRPKDASRPARPASTSSGRSDHVVFDEITIEDSPPAKTGKKERTLAEFPLGSPSPEASPPPTPKKSIEDFPMGAPSPGQKENLSSPSRPSKHISSKPLKPTGLVPTDDGKIQSFPMSLEPLAASPPESRDPPAKPSHGVTPFPLSELEIPPSPPADREASTGSAYSAFRSKQDDPSSDDAVEVEALTRTRYVSPSSQSSKRRSGDECDSDLDDPKTKRRKINRHLDASIRSSSQRLENVTVGQDLPSQPCPFCGEPFPPKPSRKLRDLLETVLRRAKRTATPGNPTGNVPWQISINVCQLHRAETTVLPEGQRRGWPKKLDFSGIPRRMKSFRLSLQAILDGTVKGGRGSFWDAACEDVRKHGTAAANSAQGQLSTFELTLPGYYGEQGYLVISTALQNMFPPQAIDPSQTAPLQPADFLRRVLLPETAVLLIIEDHDVSREEARTIMFESRSYGSAMFPAKDEGDTTIDDLDIDTPPPITAKPASKDKGKAREADAAPVWLRDVKKGVVQPQHLKWVRGSDGEIAKAVRKDLLVQPQEGSPNSESEVDRIILTPKTKAGDKTSFVKKPATPAEPPTKWRHALRNDKPMGGQPRQNGSKGTLDYPPLEFRPVKGSEKLSEKDKSPGKHPLTRLDKSSKSSVAKVGAVEKRALQAAAPSDDEDLDGTPNFNIPVKPSDPSTKTSCDLLDEVKVDSKRKKRKLPGPSSHGKTPDWSTGTRMMPKNHTVEVVILSSPMSKTARDKPSEPNKKSTRKDEETVISDDEISASSDGGQDDSYRPSSRKATSTKPKAKR